MGSRTGSLESLFLEEDLCGRDPLVLAEEGGVEVGRDEEEPRMDVDSKLLNLHHLLLLVGARGS